MTPTDFMRSAQAVVASIAGDSAVTPGLLLGGAPVGPDSVWEGADRVRCSNARAIAPASFGAPQVFEDVVVGPIPYRSRCCLASCPSVADKSRMTGGSPSIARTRRIVSAPFSSASVASQTKISKRWSISDAGERFLRWLQPPRRSRLGPTCAPTHVLSGMSSAATRTFIRSSIAPARDHQTVAVADT